MTILQKHLVFIPLFCVAFLIDQQGNIVERFEPTATKDVLAPAIEVLLK